MYELLSQDFENLYHHHMLNILFLMALYKFDKNNDIQHKYLHLDLLLDHWDMYPNKVSQ